MCKTGLNGCNFTLKQLCDSLNGASLRVHCWWFLEQHEGSPSHHASGPQLCRKKQDIWHPFWWEGECQHEHIRRWTKCSQPQSNTERMTTKIETFRRASAFALHSVLCCSKDFPSLTPALSVVKLILIEL